MAMYPIVHLTEQVQTNIFAILGASPSNHGTARAPENAFSAWQGVSIFLDLAKAAKLVWP